ncbi:Uma2 family endonuclease [Parasediminibacterium sp. JCM 36343]|uniref:Uma2 family endonuclease n=1 Tax=Parasediminibacterium sp. JCM 36343 TaxID=3374279 RepID=UPI00397A959C
MKQAIIHKTITSEEEYLLFEEQNEERHELINGNLFVMSGVSKEHYYLTLAISVLFTRLLHGTNYQVFGEMIKAKTPDGNFFYPDVMICHPDVHEYFSSEAVLILEVLSKSTRRFDLTDKFIQYQKINTLQYYLCMEQKQQKVFFYSNDAKGKWQSETFSDAKDIISLKALNISFAVGQLYDKAI